MLLWPRALYFILDLDNNRTGLCYVKFSSVSFYSEDHFQRCCSCVTSPALIIFSRGPVPKQMDSLLFSYLLSPLGQHRLLIFSRQKFSELHFLELMNFLTNFVISYKLLNDAGNSGGCFLPPDNVIVGWSCSLSLSCLRDDVSHTPHRRKLLIVKRKLHEQQTIITVVPTHGK